ncbi:hypothetical protein F5Y19DRAFT_445829 [Xylariaceae sp. FL1651]|nr:hypothetical protein F5Y19DRAFT_445829 [Xylariaceae sp. FL1651]
MMPLLLSSEKAEYGPLAAHDESEGYSGEQNLHMKPWYLGRRTFVMHAVLSISCLAVGLVFGFLGAQWAGSATRTGLHNLGINPITPIPTKVFTERKDVPFIPHAEFMGPSKEAARNWAKLTAASDSIYIPNPSEYGLKDPGIRAPFFIFSSPPEAAASDMVNLRNFYVLNNLHELHCVHMIRKRYNALVYEASTTMPLADTPIDRDWINHIEHCFEYLRLSTTCGDHMTLESDSPPGSPKEYWEDGLSWGVVHSCLDWDGLMRWQEDMVVAYNQTWT